MLVEISAVHLDHVLTHARAVLEDLRLAQLAKYLAHMLGVRRVRRILLDVVHAELVEETRLPRATHAGEFTRDDGGAVHLSRGASGSFRR